MCQNCLTSGCTFIIIKFSKPLTSVTFTLHRGFYCVACVWVLLGCQRHLLLLARLLLMRRTGCKLRLSRDALVKGLQIDTLVTTLMSRLQLTWSSLWTHLTCLTPACTCTAAALGFSAIAKQRFLTSAIKEYTETGSLSHVCWGKNNVNYSAITNILVPMKLGQISFRG